MPSSSYKTILRQFFGHLSCRRRMQLVGLLGLMLVGALAELVTIGAVVPFISLLARPEMAADLPVLQQLFSLAGWRDPDSLVLPMTLAFVGVVVLATGIRLFLTFTSNKIIFGIGHDISVRLYDTILDQPYSYHIAHNTSEVIAGVTKAQLLLGSLLKPLMQGVTSLFVGLGILVALVIVDAAAALSAGLVFAAVYWIIIRQFRMRLRKNSTIISKTQDRRIKGVQEGLGGIRDIVLDSNQAHYLEIFSRADRQLRSAQAINAFLGQAPRYLVEMIGIVLIVGLAFALATQAGGLVKALPVLGALALGAAKLLPLIQQLYKAWASFSGNLGVLEDVMVLLGLPRISMAERGVADVSFEHSIEFDDLEFSYQPGSSPVIQGLTLKIQKGFRVGIIGETGSGKSTLMDILMGLLESNSGRLLVDGEAINGDKVSAWQAKIAHVPQHIYLSDASIAENIAFGEKPDQIDMDRVRAAAQKAQIAEFVEAHRQGYKTRVGERGVQLSGGQRQRIGIARALFKTAEVLVFDEASSALDMATESAVMDAVNHLDTDLTIFIVAHRIQTLRDCDLIIRLDEGRLVGAGSYEETIGDEKAISKEASQFAS